jgi:hypothetical protein
MLGLNMAKLNILRLFIHVFSTEILSKSADHTKDVERIKTFKPSGDQRLYLRPLVDIKGRRLEAALFYIPQAAHNVCKKV